VVRLGRGLEGLHPEPLHDLGEVGAVLLLVGRVAAELGHQVGVVHAVGQDAQLLGALQLGAAERVDHLDALVEREVGEERAVLLRGAQDVSGVGRVHDSRLLSM
jgi:hypothetical protein